MKTHSLPSAVVVCVALLATSSAKAQASFVDGSITLTHLQETLYLWDNIFFATLTAPAGSTSTLNTQRDEYGSLIQLTQLQPLT